MTSPALVSIVLALLVLTALAVPLGHFLADVLEGRRHVLTPVLGGLERACLRFAGAREEAAMDWKRYTLEMLAFNFIGLIALYVLQRVQAALPFDPDHLPAVPAHMAFNAAISFASNTNWQSYAGESTMSMLTQMLGLAVQNFLSAASGIAVMAAFVRGLARHGTDSLGDFRADVVRVTVYVLLPLSLIFALVLVQQGVPQTFAPAVQAQRLEPVRQANGALVRTQTIVLGPVASQVAIKQLGTNGGGYYNANSAHPFENPTPLTNLLECIAILVLGAAACFTFGRMVGDARQGRALYAAMLLLFVGFLALALWAETRPDAALAHAGIAAHAGDRAPAMAMEGKETRLGVPASVLWASATTAASNGSVNAMHESLSPLAALVAMAFMQLGEVVFGGVGSGLYGMLAFAILAVFMAGLMVGRTPEYLGKKIEAYEMKMASVIVLVPPALVLLGTALAVSTKAGLATLSTSGTHGFGEALYAFSSAANNNGSAFAGLNAATPFYNVTLGIAMFFGRYALAIPVLAMAGSLARKKRIAPGPGTLPTHTPLFVAMLIGVVIVVGALTFFPALALGPIAEQLAMVHAAAH